MPKQIWIIDDNADSRALARIILGACPDYVLVEVPSGDAAVELLDHACPDLLILDISMPGANGFDVLQAVRARADVCHVPIIAYTSFAAREERSQFMTRGFDGCVCKPILDENELLMPVARLLSPADVPGTPAATVALHR
jgi:two-component system cell cycle response regulator DivK